DGFALEQFHKDLAPVMQKTWDVVFNYSNDRVSTHLTSLLKANSTKHVGIRFNDTCDIEYSNEWSILFNDILTEVKYTPVNFIDTYHNILSVKNNTDNFVLKTKDEYNHSAYQNFLDIRKMESDEDDIKIVGIQVTSSTSTKMLVHEELISLIDSLYMHTNLFPVLLVAPTDEERRIASVINGEFNNSLVSIESDFLAMNSVLLNLDLLITPDTAVKHLADLTDLPVIEYSLGESPLFKQGTTNTESLIISPIVTKRSFSKSEVENSLELQNQNVLITSEDIMALVRYSLFKEDISSHEFQNDVTVYRPNKDILGTKYTYLAGSFDPLAETERLASRQLIMKKLLSKDDTNLYGEMITLDIETSKQWLNECKDLITDISKSLLATLRSLLQLDNSNEKMRAFVLNLTELCEFCECDSQFMRIPLLRFRSRLEALNTSDFLNSSREVEGLLYELKSDIQHQVEIIKITQEKIRNTADIARASSAKEI
ncbi:glycosyltransferase family 9 protein, partial [Bacteriovorax sp. DB6_IX]|uniref:glycosyltransferase family 9 protein n=1 Tax=Bacteriovorax sp. DB6_IX TaxID=1353530 RepID=UPI00038A3636